MTKVTEGVWIIIGNLGIYYGSHWATRRGAIYHHECKVGRCWEKCKKLGDRAVRAWISYEVKK